MQRAVDLGEPPQRAPERPRHARRLVGAPRVERQWRRRRRPPPRRVEARLREPPHVVAAAPVVVVPVPAVAAAAAVGVLVPLEAGRGERVGALAAAHEQQQRLRGALQLARREALLVAQGVVQVERLARGPPPLRLEQREEQPHLPPRRDDHRDPEQRVQQVEEKLQRLERHHRPEDVLHARHAVAVAERAAAVAGDADAEGARAVAGVDGGVVAVALQAAAVDAECGREVRGRELNRRGDARSVSHLQRERWVLFRDERAELLLDGRLGGAREPNVEGRVGRARLGQRVDRQVLGHEAQRQIRLGHRRGAAADHRRDGLPEGVAADAEREARGRVARRLGAAEQQAHDALVVDGGARRDVAQLRRVGGHVEHRRRRRGAQLEQRAGQPVQRRRQQQQQPEARHVAHEQRELLERRLARLDCAVGLAQRAHEQPRAPAGEQHHAAREDVGDVDEQRAELLDRREPLLHPLGLAHLAKQGGRAPARAEDQQEDGHKGHVEHELPRLAPHRPHELAVGRQAAPAALVVAVVVRALPVLAHLVSAQLLAQLEGAQAGAEDQQHHDEGERPADDQENVEA